MTPTSIVIAEMPDEITAAAVATAVGGVGRRRASKTVVLLSAEDIDRAIDKHASYRAPGA